MRRIENCYLCGSTADLTNDHVPPKSFFQPARAKNLITVRCCKKCNHAYSLDDEAILIWLTSVAGNRSEGIVDFKKHSGTDAQEKAQDSVDKLKEHVKIETVKLPTGPSKIAFELLS